MGRRKSTRIFLEFRRTARHGNLTAFGSGGWVRRAAFSSASKCPKPQTWRVEYRRRAACVALLRRHPPIILTTIVVLAHQINIGRISIVSHCLTPSTDYYTQPLRCCGFFFHLNGSKRHESIVDWYPQWQSSNARLLFYLFSLYFVCFDISLFFNECTVMHSYHQIKAKKSYVQGVNQLRQ
jgi:hypothetical protein